MAKTQGPSGQLEYNLRLGKETLEEVLRILVIRGNWYESWTSYLARRDYKKAWKQFELLEIILFPYSFFQMRFQREGLHDHLDTSGELEADFTEDAWHFKQTVKRAYMTNTGNCMEHAALAYHLLLNKGHRNIKYVTDSGDKHAFVVIGMASRIVDSDWRNWGDAAVVCDPWERKCYPASDIPDKMILGPGFEARVADMLWSDLMRLHERERATGLPAPREFGRKKIEAFDR